MKTVSFLRIRARILTAGVVLGAVATALPAQSKFELPPETGTFKPGPGAELANAHCLLCHSSEYVTTQPPLPRAFWQGNVEKMQQKFGAPVPPKEVEAIVNYLTATYGAKPGVAPSSPAGAKLPASEKARR